MSLLKQFMDDKPEEIFEYIGLDFKQQKNTIDMTNGYQIDDYIPNLLESNAKLKILLTNNRNTYYNDVNKKEDYKNAIEDLYIVNTLEEVEQILEFNLDNPDFT